MELVKHVVRIVVLMTPMMILPEAVFADVIPSKAKPKGDRAQVQGAMVDRGVAEGEARTLVSQMTPDDAAYFGGSPDRVQMVSGILFEEWIGAAILVVGIPLGIYGTMAAIRTYGN